MRRLGARGARRQYDGEEPGSQAAKTTHYTLYARPLRPVRPPVASGMCVDHISYDTPYGTSHARHTTRPPTPAHSTALGTIRPLTSPSPTRTPSGPGAHADSVTTSPSSKNVRLPSGSSSGSRPFQVSSSSDPR